MAAGGGGGDSWKWMLGGGGALVALGMAIHHAHVAPAAVYGSLLALGGLLVVFGACECMIKSVDAVADIVGWSPFVAGTMAGLASNLPEVVMIGFIVADNPRMAFIMTALTMQVGALAFGLYCAFLPQDEHGAAHMPAPLIGLSTDLYACAGAMLLVQGFLMVMLREFKGAETEGLDARDMIVIGLLFLSVQYVAISRLIARFSKANVSDDDAAAEAKAAGKPVPVASAEGEASEGAEGAAAGDDADAPEASDEAAAELEEGDGTKGTWGDVAFYGVVGCVASIIGGHAVGDFADILVTGMKSYGFGEMVGALVLSFFACAGVLVMIVSTHVKGLYDLAIANVSGAVTQVPFVVWPVVMMMHAGFALLGIVPTAEDGTILPIDLETTAVVVLGFPPMLILWKSIQDDGKVNRVETAAMCAVFVLTLYLLGAHG